MSCDHHKALWVTFVAPNSLQVDDYSSKPVISPGEFLYGIFHLYNHHTFSPGHSGKM